MGKYIKILEGLRKCRDCDTRKETYIGRKLSSSGKILKKKVSLCMDCLEIMMVRDEKGRYIYNDGFETWVMEF